MTSMALKLSPKKMHLFVMDFDGGSLTNLIGSFMNINTDKKQTWDLILKIIIAVASAIAGALGANAMSF